MQTSSYFDVPISLDRFCFRVNSWEEAEAKASVVPEHCRDVVFQKIALKEQEVDGDSQTKFIHTEFRTFKNNTWGIVTTPTSNFDLFKGTGVDIRDLSRDHIVSVIYMERDDGPDTRVFCCFKPRPGCSRLLKGNCKKCGSTGNTMVCSLCKSVSYCDKTCQREDWSAHKPVCKMLRTIKETDYIRIHAGIRRLKFAKRHGKLPQTAIQRLESLPGWSWDFENDAFMRYIEPNETARNAYTLLEEFQIDDHINAIEAMYIKYGIPLDHELQLSAPLNLPTDDFFSHINSEAPWNR